MINEIVEVGLFFLDGYIFTRCFDLTMHTVETILFTMPQICKGLIDMISEMFRKLLKKTKPSKSQLISIS